MEILLKKPASIRSIPPDQITDEDIVETYRLESMLFPAAHVPGPELSRSWYAHNPLTLLGVRDIASGRLIGFLQVLPINDALFETIKRGHFDDTKFSVDDIVLYDRPGAYKLYIASFCIHPDYNSNLQFFKTMYNTFFDMLVDLARERGVVVTEVVADGITEKGRLLCRGMGLKKQTASSHGSDVYYGVIFPRGKATVRLKGEPGKRLLAVYEEIGMA